MYKIVSLPPLGRHGCPYPSNPFYSATRSLSRCRKLPNHSAAINMTEVLLDGNTARVFFGPDSAFRNLRVKVNSPSKQYVTLSGGIRRQLSGSGESNSTLCDEPFSPTTKEVQVVFEYDAGNGEKKASKLRYGGPYEIGRFRMLVLVAENGDDSDYNDVVVEFSGHNV